MTVKESDWAWTHERNIEIERNIEKKSYKPSVWNVPNDSKTSYIYSRRKYQPMKGENKSIHTYLARDKPNESNREVVKTFFQCLERF